MSIVDKNRFKCARCGHCCSGTPGYVWVSINEMHAMAKHLSISLDDFGVRYIRRVGARYSLIENGSGACIFFQKEIGCKIYDARPSQCRVFPFDAENQYRFPEWMITECEGLRVRPDLGDDENGC
ncbi:MAG: YkgJ family cysteine cluster protein [Chlamydiota bacterium]|nr:YkgJ family cysteine cluster protein [Chlamydiota bacterium]